jgi:hypothetical protein
MPKLTHDNLVSVEFDTFGFSIKDLHTKMEMLQCDSDDELYPLNFQPSKALHTTTNNIELWHQHLDHLGGDCLLQTLRSFHFKFNCNKTTSHICQACQLGEHVRLPFFFSPLSVDTCWCLGIPCLEQFWLSVLSCCY